MFWRRVLDFTMKPWATSVTLQGSQHSTDPLIRSLLFSVSFWLLYIIRFHLQNIYFFCGSNLRQNRKLSMPSGTTNWCIKWWSSEVQALRGVGFWKAKHKLWKKPLLESHAPFKVTRHTWSNVGRVICMVLT